MYCPLCSSLSSFYSEQREKKYYKCTICEAIFMDAAFFLDEKDEKNRYLEHNNDVNDERYQKFVSPIVGSVLSSFSHEELGLDFGSGTGPVITKLLYDRGYNIESYDPFFDNNKEFLNRKYDYICSCEVVEHFHNPHKEFTLLKSLLRANGKLFIMTELSHSERDFFNWYYKDDPTHVFFYTEKTFEWICKTFDFKSLIIDGRLIVLG